jgi:cytochrome P450
LSATPVYEADFYSDAFICDPWPHYARMRALGPVVWLPEHGNFALTRHATVLAALRNPDLFVSGRGVAACEFANEITRGNSAASDGDRHRAIREASSGPLTPEALEAIRGRIEQVAAELVDKLIAAGEFDAMADLASHLPLTVVRELVGCRISGATTCFAGPTQPSICSAFKIRGGEPRSKCSWSSAGS